MSPQINFSFCKGDDNYGGIQRKELDDFCKSLGKTMNLVCILPYPVCVVRRVPIDY